MKKETKNNLRIRMESSVIAVNKHLEDKVKEMDDDQLLNNMHPLDVDYFKKRLGRLL